MSDDRDDRPLVLATRMGKHCGHWNPVVCESERVVTCASCGATLDALEVLYRMARYRDRLLFDRKHFENEIARLRAERDGLQRDVRNLKGTMYRAKRKAMAEAPPEPPPANVVPLRPGKGAR